VPRNTLISQAEKTIEASPWVVPGVLVGAYALTRLPFGLLTGLAIGFAAGWTLRAEQGSGDRGDGAARRHTASERQRAEQHAKEEEKVDEMSDDSFPASDPPSYTAARTGKPKTG
jgi:hypothetical protein